MKKIILLTGTINPKISKTPLTKITNEIERKEQYIKNLKFFLKETNFNIIIFCENTNYSLENEVRELKKLASENGKEIEFLSFMGNNKIIEKKGKGYGEGEIIEYALNKSKFLSDEKNCFYKITGRIFLSNINSLIKTSVEHNYFIKTGFRSEKIDTRFFKVNILFYKENILRAHKNVDDLNGIYLEHCYYNALKKVSKKINKFKKYPKFIGVSGSTGNSYELSLLSYFKKNIMLKLKFL